MVVDPEIATTVPEFEELNDRQCEAEIRRLMPTIFEATYLYIALLEAGNRLGIGSETLLRVRRDPVLAADLVLTIAGRATVLRSECSEGVESDGILRLSDAEFDRLIGYFCEPVSRLPIDAFAINILTGADISTIGQVVQLTPGDLVDLPGRGRRNKRIGDATLRHLRNEFFRRGLRFGAQFSHAQLHRLQLALDQIELRPFRLSSI